MEKYKVIDLFAGAGGLSYGFLQTGKYRIVAAAEINKNAQATYKRNISDKVLDFVFIDNVIGYDFKKLNEQLGGIDVVIGGPPCQGFSNANRQKNHLISMNNGLVKEFFRAIKEIKPKAFVMENVSMLRSDTHRFYESIKDNEEIQSLIDAGFVIPKKEDILYISNYNYDNIDYNDIENIDLSKFSLPQDLVKLLNVLAKNIKNTRRLPAYLIKHLQEIIRRINDVLDEDYYDSSITLRLRELKNIFSSFSISDIKTKEYRDPKLDELIHIIMENESLISYIVSLQKMISIIEEIISNGIIGHYSVDDMGSLIYKTYSYSVIDYINAILGGEYIQKGDTVNAEWFGVPQERKRHIVIGLRKDLYNDVMLELPKRPDTIFVPTVGDAILDLQDYEVGYNIDYKEVVYNNNENISNYARLMREDSCSVKNHITTRSTDTALERFKKIKPGCNFHSLSKEMKTTYTKPERTQNTIYLRLNPDAPSGTVVNVRKSMWIHPVLDRAVTVREAARLQSFPDCFEFIGTKDSQFQQVGNAVPPLLAKGIAEKLFEYL